MTETKSHLTLEQFRATKRIETKDTPGSILAVQHEHIEKGYVYECDLAIEIYDDNTYSLILCNEEYVSEDLAELEEILYEEWYLREC